jgi:hypothetical protein
MIFISDQDKFRTCWFQFAVSHAARWSVTNIPILGVDGYVRWILLRAEEMTELVKQRHEVGLSGDGKVAPS